MKKSYYKIIFFFLVCITFSNGYSQSNSLKNIWEDEKQNDSIRFNALEEYYEINNQINPDSALVSLDYHYELARKKNAPLQLYQASKRKGNIHRLKGNFDIAMNAYIEADSLALKLNDPILQAGIIGNIGNVYIYRQDYRLATQYFSKALKIYQEEGDKENESQMLTSLGSVYLIIHNYELALNYYQKALVILDKRGFEDRSTAIIYINIGWTNYEKGRYKDAKNNYTKGLKILQVKNEKFFIASCYSTLARINLKLNLLDEANDYAAKNLALNKELDIKTGIINAKIIIALITFETNIKEATRKGEAILANLPVNTNKEIKKSLYELLYKCYKSQNKLALSLEMHELYTSYNDSIQQEKNNFAVAREVVKNDFDLKLQENKVESEKEKAALKIIQLKRTYGIIASAVLLMAFIIYYFIASRKKMRQRRDALLKEIESLKINYSKTLIAESNSFELKREKIETSINRKLNETDWNVLKILFDDPVITNNDIAEKAFMSVPGIGSSLRRMYEYFDIKESKYKKISLLLEAIKISNSRF